MAKLSKKEQAMTDAVNSKNAELHLEAIKRFDEVITLEGNQRRMSVEDTQFAQVQGSQFNDTQKSTKVDRPRFEINKVALPINQFIGDQIQSSMSIKVRAAGGDATTDLANTRAGLVRDIENRSNFKATRKNAVKEIANGGIAAWYVTTEFADDLTSEQEIRIKKIVSAATSAYMDCNAKEENKRDGMWGFVATDITTEAFKRQWPGKVLASVNEISDSKVYRHWRKGDTVKVADYWMKVPTTKVIAQMSDGQMLEIDDRVNTVLDELAKKGVVIEKQRKVKTFKVIMFKMSGNEFLSGPHEWVGARIPIIMGYGYNYYINGIHHWHGMVRFARDPQMVYNHAVSSSIEAGANAPKDPYFYTQKQVEGYTQQYKNYNISNDPFMPFNHDPDNPGPPKRGGAPAFQAALVQQIAQADQDIMATTGRFSPSLGDNPKNQSGRALREQRAQGDIGTAELSDNLAGMVEYTGEIINEIMPKILDTKRQVRVVSEDGSSEVVFINSEERDEQTGEMVIVNDLAKGRYSIEVDVGPSYATQRTEALDFLSAMTEKNDLFNRISPDLLAKNVDFPFSEELTKRARKVMIADGIVEPTKEEQEEVAQPDPMQEAVKEAEVAKIVGEVDGIELDNDQKRVDIQKTRADTHKTLTDVLEIKAELGLPVTDQELDVRQKNMGLLNNELTQDIINADDAEDVLNNQLNQQQN